MAETPAFSDLLPGPWPASPFPAPRRVPALAPLQTPPPRPDWNQVIAAANGYPHFCSASYFVQCYGAMPWRRIFLLDPHPDGTTLLAELATRFDLARVAVAHGERLQYRDQPASYQQTALALAPHLLLEVKNDLPGAPKEDCIATLYHSAATDPALLTEITQLLHSRLPALPAPESTFYVLHTDDQGNIDFVPVAFETAACNLADHYNDDLLPAHVTIVRRLAARRDKGIVILHGPPGTGKTSYFRHLCGLVPGKRKLFVPTHMAHELAGPVLMRLLAYHPNSILLIEDAEQLLLRREKAGGGPSAVSSLLNLTDGLMADALHIQVVCTLNTELALIDPAILRKGRLIASYHFGPLALPKTQALAAAVGWPVAPAEPLTLAELFNPDDADFSPVAEMPLGFANGRKG